MDETMSRVRSLITTSLLTALGAWLVPSAAPVAAEVSAIQGKPMEVTSDTTEYCLYLLDRVSVLVRLAPAPVPRDVTDLTTEGQRMCAHGQTRGGIMRLRSALMIMEKNDSPAHR